MRPATYNAPGRGDGAGAWAVQDYRRTKTTAPERRAQRLPAYGRRLRDALVAGYRPKMAGGGIIVTSDWTYARAFAPGRLVVPASEHPGQFDFSFLHGCDVVVVVPAADELHGEALVAAIRDAGAALVVLAVNREIES